METLAQEPIQDVGTLIEKFCKDCKLRGMTKESIRRYKSSLKLYASYFNLANLVNLNMQMLEDFLGHLKFERKVKPKTIKNNFSALSAFYDYLAFHGFADRNLVLTFRKRYLRMYKNDNSDSQRKLLTIEEMSQLVNSILDPRDKA
ncbi:MAG: phage integrase N-terminal SAM-like domain-containing protein, partial [Candidatus Ranarchaeia archaeon]